MRIHDRSPKSREKDADSMMALSTGLFTAGFVAILTLLVSFFVQLGILTAKGDSARSGLQDVGIILSNYWGLYILIICILALLWFCAYLLRERALDFYDKDHTSKQNGAAHKKRASMKETSMKFLDWSAVRLGIRPDVRIIPKIALALVVFGYAALLMWSGLAGDSFKLFDTWTRQELITFGIGLIISISLPFAIATSVSIFETQDKVSKLTYSPVTVKSHNSTRVITDFMAGFTVADVFIGFRDPDLVGRLVEILKDKSKMYAVYINPGVLPLSIEKGLFSDSIYVVDCPRESCVVFGYDSYNNLHCLTLRRALKDRICWTAEIQSNSEFALYLKETFKSHYQQERLAVPLQSITMARCLNKTHRDRIRRNREISNLTLHFDSRMRGYQFATDLIEHAEHSLYAVDRTPPKDWRSNAEMRMYEQAHKKTMNVHQSAIIPGPGVVVEADKAAGCSIKRVHVFSKAGLKAEKEDYYNFVDRQTAAGVSLFFLEEEKLAGIDVKEGFIIIDDEAVFVSQEQGREYGRMEFNKETISFYRTKFIMVEAEKPTEVKSREDIDRILDEADINKGETAQETKGT